MLNPDGVVAGNYRTCINGLDLNRRYLEPEKEVCPAIEAVKRLIEEQKNVREMYTKIAIYVPGLSRPLD